jgi:hypothetical protein
MAAVDLAVFTLARAGLRTDNGLAANAGDGNSFPNDGKVFLQVANAGVAACVVTLVTSEEVDGLAIANPTVSVPAGQTYLIGPFKPSLFGRTVTVTYDQVVTVTVKPVTFTADPN